MSDWRARARRGTPFAFTLVALLLITSPSRSQSPPAAPSDPPVSSEGPAIPAAVGYVNDVAGVMDEPSRAKLEAFLDQVHKKTGAQFAVLTMQTTAPLEPSEYKVKVFEQWGIGDKERDDGLLMLVAIDEREVRFETGYGLEGALPDGLQSRIFRDEMAPRFRENNYAGGITAGVLAASARIAAEKGVTLEWDGKELRYDGGRSGRKIPLWLLLLAVFMLILFATAFSNAPLARRRRRGLGGWNDWGGFGGGGFGGFGGGGGSFGGFGGGGGGGGSFGGFGGGGSGGGGGGGKW